MFTVSRRLPPVTKADFLKGADDHTCALVETMLAISAAEPKRLILVTSGFVPDLCLGHIHRPHHDLDLLIAADDVPFFRTKLEQEQWTLSQFRSKNPLNTFKATKAGQEVDIGGIAVTASEVYDETDGSGQKYIWPVQAHELIFSRQIDDIDVRFVCPKAILFFKTENTRQDERDEADRTILARFM